ncbi:TREM1 protein, partial [Halcyon senegalensis]|nr:TREM1 protein [Halcyon senegalensis]
AALSAPCPSPHLISPGLQAQTPAVEERRWEGSALHIQCPYSAQLMYRYQKSWCRMTDGQWNPLLEVPFDPYAKTKRLTKGNMTIVDSQINQTLSVSMTNLQAEDSGTYSCAYHDTSRNKCLPMKMISLNVFKEMHRWELESLSVPCPYNTEMHSLSPKAWCQRGPTGCKILLKTSNTLTQSKKKSLEDRDLIQDDIQKRTFTITMQKLQAHNTGVYWCALYRNSQPTRLMEVRLSVSKSEYLLAAKWGRWQVSAPPPLLVLPPVASDVKTFIILSGVLSILFILALISTITLYVRSRKQLKRRGNREGQDIYEKPEDAAQLGSTARMESHNDDSKDLQYATLNFPSQLSPEDTLYCNVEPSQAHRKAREENVDYAIIALK